MLNQINSAEFRHFTEDGRPAQACNRNEPAFDDGTRRGIWIYEFDVTLHF